MSTLSISSNAAHNDHCHHDERMSPTKSTLICWCCSISSRFFCSNGMTQVTHCACLMRDDKVHAAATISVANCVYFVKNINLPHSTRCLCANTRCQLRNRVHCIIDMQIVHVACASSRDSRTFPSAPVRQGNGEASVCESGGGSGGGCRRLTSSCHVIRVCQHDVT